jgi:hypothetical protein
LSIIFSGLILSVSAIFFFLLFTKGNIERFPKSKEKAASIFAILFVIFVFLVVYVMVLFFLKLNIVQTFLALALVTIPGGVILFQALSRMKIEV